MMVNSGNAGPKKRSGEETGGRREPGKFGRSERCVCVCACLGMLSLLQAMILTLDCLSDPPGKV